jgi:hypothetical protein
LKLTKILHLLEGKNCISAVSNTADPRTNLNVFKDTENTKTIFAWNQQINQKRDKKLALHTIQVANMREQR